MGSTSVRDLESGKAEKQKLAEIINVIKSAPANAMSKEDLENEIIKRNTEYEGVNATWRSMMNKGCTDVCLYGKDCPAIIVPVTSKYKDSCIRFYKESAVPVLNKLVNLKRVYAKQYGICSTTDFMCRNNLQTENATSEGYGKYCNSFKSQTKP